MKSAANPRSTGCLGGEKGRITASFCGGIFVEIIRSKLGFDGLTIVVVISPIGDAADLTWVAILAGTP